MFPEFAIQILPAPSTATLTGPLRPPPAWLVGEAPALLEDTSVFDPELTDYTVPVESKAIPPKADDPVLTPPPATNAPLSPNCEVVPEAFTIQM